MSKEIDKEYESTMSIDIKNLQIKGNNKIIQIQIWDLVEVINYFKACQIYSKMHL